MRNEDLYYPNENKVFADDVNCEGCLCYECNENEASGGKCDPCSKCKDEKITVCPKNKFRNDYGD